MKIHECVIYLLGGLGVFMTAMSMMSDSLQRASGTGLKKMLNHITNNRFIGVGIGALVTAIIQSSSATTVMLVGLVNADVMTLEQATAVIMGANIGTTITGVLASLQSLNLSLYFGLLAFIGVMMMFLKGDFIKNIAGIIAGLGLIFIGLDHMSDAFDDDGIKQRFESVFKKVDFQLLLLLIGAVFTCIIQSSSAMTGLIIIFVQNKVMTLNSAIYAVLGANIGTCITALLSSIGTTVNARRTAIIHLMFNVIGTVIFIIVVWPLEKYVVKLLQKISPQPAMQIAWFHVFFNIITTIILLGFIKVLVRISKIIIRDRKKVEKVSSEDKENLKKVQFINKRFLISPEIAIKQGQKEIESMAIMARENLNRCFKELCDQDESHIDNINKYDDAISFLNLETTKYLIKLSSVIDEKLTDEVAKFFYYLNDIERIEYHAKCLLDDETKMKESDIKLSEEIIADLKNIMNIINSMYDISLKVFKPISILDCNEMEDLNEKLKNVKTIILKNHIERLAHNKYSIKIGTYFNSAIAHFDSIASHLIHIVNITNVDKIKVSLNETYKGLATQQTSDIFIITTKRHKLSE